MVSSPLFTTDTDTYKFYPDTVFLDLPNDGMYHQGFPEYVRNELSSDPKTLNIISDNKKVLVQLTTSYYHFIHDQLGSILYYNQEFPDYEIIVDVAHAWPYVKRENVMYDVVFEMLDACKIKYTKINSHEINGINLNNFYFNDMNYMSRDMPRRVHEFFSKFVEDPTVVPFRNVYFSRTGIDFGRNYEDRFDPSRNYPKILQNDFRVDDHRALDDFFEKQGFEVFVPENKFRNFKDQIEYMYSVKTLVAISGSGLTNSILMQPGQTVIEITSPMITTNQPQYTNTGLEEYTADIHHYFSPLSFKRGHLHISISNRTKKTKDVIRTMLSNPYLVQIFNSVKKSSRKGIRLWGRKN
jgi:hypothetical protein